MGLKKNRAFLDLSSESQLHAADLWMPGGLHRLCVQLLSILPETTQLHKRFSNVSS